MSRPQVRPPCISPRRGTRRSGDGCSDLSSPGNTLSTFRHFRPTRRPSSVAFRSLNRGDRHPRPNYVLLGVFMMFVVAERVFAAFIVNCAVTGLALIFVLLRLWTRAFIKKRVGLDDLLIIGALVRTPWSWSGGEPSLTSRSCRLPPSDFSLSSLSVRVGSSSDAWDQMLRPNDRDGARVGNIYSI